MIDVLLIIRATVLWPHLLGETLHNLCQDRIATPLVLRISGPHQDQMRVKPDTNANATDIIPYAPSVSFRHHRSLGENPPFSTTSCRISPIAIMSTSFQNS